MKSYRLATTSAFRLGMLVAFVFVITGCATIDSIIGKAKQTEDKQQQVQHTAESQLPESTEEGAEAAPKLTPEEMRIVELKAQPNLYFAGSPIPAEAASILFQQALEAKKQNEFDRAETLFTQLTQDFPTLSGPFMQLGDLVLSRYKINSNPSEEQLQAALTSAANFYQQAIGVNQHNYFAHNRLAKIYREQGQFELAEDHYKQAIDSWPAFDNAYLNLGILYDLYMGKKVLALRQYQTYQGLQINPGRKVNGWIADMERQIARANKQ